MRREFAGFFIALMASIVVAGCGGGDGSSTVSISLADAKPTLPVDAEQVLVTFDEVRVHRSGGGWTSLPLAETPYTVDLLQFSDGKTTELVPPVELEPGKYTQIRLGVTEGSIVTGQGPDIPLGVPSQNLKTDQNFDLDAEGGVAVDLTVHFDLSKSIVAQGNGVYHLKPVLHLIETQEAATIRGRIAASSFGANTEAIVTVESEGETYTQVVVQKGVQDPTEFGVFWLVPNHSYGVEVAIQGVQAYIETVDAAELGPGETFWLNNDGLPIALVP